MPEENEVIEEEQYVLEYHVFNNCTFTNCTFTFEKISQTGKPGGGDPPPGT